MELTINEIGRKELPDELVRLLTLYRDDGWAKSQVAQDLANLVGSVTDERVTQLLEEAVEEEGPRIRVLFEVFRSQDMLHLAATTFHPKEEPKAKSTGASPPDNQTRGATTKPAARALLPAFDAWKIPALVSGDDVRHLAIPRQYVGAIEYLSSMTFLDRLRGDVERRHERLLRAMKRVQSGLRMPKGEEGSSSPDRDSGTTRVPPVSG